MNLSNDRGAPNPNTPVTWSYGRPRPYTDEDVELRAPSPVRRRRGGTGALARTESLTQAHFTSGGLMSFWALSACSAVNLFSQRPRTKDQGRRTKDQRPRTIVPLCPSSPPNVA